MMAAGWLLVLGVCIVSALGSLVPVAGGQYVEEDPFLLFESGKYIELSPAQMVDNKKEQKDQRLPSTFKRSKSSAPDYGSKYWNERIMNNLTPAVDNRANTLGDTLLDALSIPYTQVKSTNNTTIQGTYPKHQALEETLVENLDMEEDKQLPNTAPCLWRDNWHSEPLLLLVTLSRWLV